MSDWKPGDPCATCGSRDTTYNHDTGAHCGACGRSDADETWGIETDEQRCDSCASSLSPRFSPEHGAHFCPTCFARENPPVADPVPAPTVGREDEALAVAVLRTMGKTVSLEAAAMLIVQHATLSAEVSRQAAELSVLRAREAQVREELRRHQQYRPAAWDAYDCCGQCNADTGGYVAWPCQVSVRLAAALVAATAGSGRTG